MQTLVRSRARARARLTGTSYNSRNCTFQELDPGCRSEASISDKWRNSCHKNRQQHSIINASLCRLGLCRASLAQSDIAWKPRFSSSEFGALTGRPYFEFAPELSKRALYARMFISNLIVNPGFDVALQQQDGATARPWMVRATAY